MQGRLKGITRKKSNSEIASLFGGHQNNITKQLNQKQNDTKTKQQFLTV